MKVIMAILTALASTLASAQDWTHKMTKDAFSDEEIWVASVHHQVEGQQFTLFVNCRDDGSVNVGLTGTDIDPAGGEQVSLRRYHRIPVRFDDDESSEANFVEQGDVMFLAVAPVLLTYLPEKAESLQKRVPHLFVKKLADGSRLGALRGPLERMSDDTGDRTARSSATVATSSSRWPRSLSLVTCSPTSSAESIGSERRLSQHDDRIVPHA